MYIYICSKLSNFMQMSFIIVVCVPHTQAIAVAVNWQFIMNNFYFSRTQWINLALVIIGHPRVQKHGSAQSRTAENVLLFDCKFLFYFITSSSPFMPESIGFFCDLIYTNNRQNMMNIVIWMDLALLKNILVLWHLKYSHWLFPQNTRYLRIILVIRINSCLSVKCLRSLSNRNILHNKSYSTFRNI